MPTIDSSSSMVRTASRSSACWSMPVITVWESCMGFSHSSPSVQPGTIVLVTLVAIGFIGWRQILLLGPDRGQCGDRVRVRPPLRLPQGGAQEGAGTMDEDFIDLDD